ncbi:MAG: helix-turn-helix domain-containing protein [Actinomycetota bacterium]
MEALRTEHERRLVAVSRVLAGEQVVAVARSVGRTEQWLHKWLRRYEAEGDAGLRDRSRAPKHPPPRTPPHVVEAVLGTRDALEESEHGGVGAEAIRYELELKDLDPLPSLSTIERILRRAGKTAKPKRFRGTERHRPRPAVAVPGVLHQADWVGPRYLARRLSFHSLHAVDVGGGGAQAAQFSDRRLERAAAFFAEVAWPVLGIPLAAQVDNAFALARARRIHPFNLFVKTCLLFGVEVVVCPPNELGWMNHVESFNALWQARTIRRHRYHSVQEVVASSGRFVDYFMHRRPHPALTVATNGSRFPAEVLLAEQEGLRFPPEGFTLDAYRRGDGKIELPIARGRLTFLRRVHEEGWIDAAGTRFAVGHTYAGLCVAATISTYHRRLRVRLDGKVISQRPFPLPGPVAAPWFDPAPRGLSTMLPDESSPMS